MSQMHWLKRINIREHLAGDIELIYDECGIGVLMELWDKLPSMSLYISTKPLTECKREYVRLYFDGTNAKQLARELKVSERFVLKAVISPSASEKAFIASQKQAKPETDAECSTCDDAQVVNNSDQL